MKLVVSLLFLLGMATQANALRCPGFKHLARLKKLNPYSGSLSQVQFQELHRKPLTSYFPTKADPNRDSNGIEVLPPSEVAAFHQDADRYLKNYSIHRGKLRHGADFQAWWKANASTLATGPQIRALQASNTTLGRYIEEEHMKFLSRQPPPPRSGWLPLAGYLGRKGKSASRAALGLAKGLLILGPAVVVLNSALSPVIDQVAQDAKQVGTRILSPVSDGYQWVRSNPAKAKSDLANMKRINDEMKHLMGKIDKMSPEQFQEQWTDVQKAFFGYYMRTNKILPTYLREGRSFARDLTAHFSNNATSVAVFDIQRMQYKTRLDELKAIESARALTSAEVAARKEYETQMSAAEERIASGLAMWKLTEIMYPDYTLATDAEVQKVPLLGLYRAFADGLRFDLYKKHFSRQMLEQLKKMDGQIGQMQAAIENAGAAEVAVVRP